MFFCLFLFLKWNEEKDRKSCSGSCRGTNLKQLEHEIEFSQSSVASRHTPQKLTETKTVCICGVMQSFLSWPPRCFLALGEKERLITGYRSSRILFTVTNLNDRKTNKHDTVKSQTGSFYPNYKGTKIHPSSI